VKESLSVSLSLLRLRLYLVPPDLDDDDVALAWCGLNADMLTLAFIVLGFTLEFEEVVRLIFGWDGRLSMSRPKATAFLSEGGALPVRFMMMIVLLLD